MKKTYLAILFLIIAGWQAAWAQSVAIRLKDNTLVHYNLSEVDSLVFSEETYHEYVDLGLPSGTLWATTNIGADSPEDYGTYFAWGDTEGNGVFNFEYYKFCIPQTYSMSKYCTRYSEGSIDGKTFLDAEDDAATVIWGSEWRMPSKKQMEELINEEFTSNEWTSQNDVIGLKITSKKNGNSIFLPAAGQRLGWTSESEGALGSFWSRSLENTTSRVAHTLDFSQSFSVMVSSSFRYTGLPVRPVRYTPSVMVSSIELSCTEMKLGVNETMPISCTVLPEDAENPYVSWEISGDGTVAYLMTSTNSVTGEESHYVSTNSPGTCTITVRSADGSGVYAQCQVTVKSNIINGREYVDLGLPSGTLWAICNVGANSPEEYGDYFAWGETTPRVDDSYNKYGVTGHWTKYCLSRSDGHEGFVDNLRELLPEDDAATVNWGSKWMTPSQDMFYELFDESLTTAQLTEQNGINGYLVTSKSNGNSLFLPAAGIKWPATSKVNVSGYYLTRRLVTSNTIEHFGFDTSGTFFWDAFSRNNFGQSVRPVVFVPVTEIELDKTDILLERGDFDSIHAIVLPENASFKEVECESSDEEVASVYECSPGEFDVVGWSVGTCTITCRATDGSGVYAECRVRVTANDVVDNHEYVEIGGKKWATMNVGATTVADSWETCCGDYFAWSETEPRYASIVHTSGGAASFSWKNGYTNGYYDSSAYPSYTSNTLDATHDVATAKWGGEWRTPTPEEFRALEEACYSGNMGDVRLTSLTGKVTTGGIYWLDKDQTYEPDYTNIAGVLFVDKNDISKRLFFPAAGRITRTQYDGWRCCYWTSSLYTNGYNVHNMIAYAPQYINVYDYQYWYSGFSVRPVNSR
ncbi:MAG: Ig-like domain-containing protein [Bacteroidaceae bacterium]|nr:Ig-like domain-containing protein [Bacteroidaceae bacterium]